MISFGPVFLELVFGHVRALPLPGEEVFTDDFAMSCGGAVTSASAAARAGARTGLCTVLGEDLGSRVVMEHCAAHGVGVSASARLPGRRTGVTVVLNFDGDRGFVSHVPPPSAGDRPETERWRDVLRRERPRWCYLHAGEGVADLLHDARELGTRVVLDVTFGDVRHPATVIECVRLADIFVPNEAELLRLTGAGSLERALADARAWDTTLVVKRGRAGALIAGRDGVTEVARGVSPVPVRDLTGAGDSFAGAMIAALLRGAVLPEAVAEANAAGSAAVGRLGAVGEVDLADISGAARALGARLAGGLAAVRNADAGD